MPPTIHILSTYDWIEIFIDKKRWYGKHSFSGMNDLPELLQHLGFEVFEDYVEADNPENYQENKKVWDAKLKEWGIDPEKSNL